MAGSADVGREAFLCEQLVSMLMHVQCIKNGQQH